MMTITARHADEWNTWGAPDLAGAKRAAFVAACESAGVDPATRRTTTQALIVLTDDTATKEEVLAGPMGERTLAGSAAEITEQLGRYVALGFDEFIVPDFTLGDSLAERREGLERIRSEVLAPLL